MHYHRYQTFMLLLFEGSTDLNWEIQQHGNFNDLNVITMGQT